MTNWKGAAILGAMIIAGATLLTSFPASSATAFLQIPLRHVDRACKSVPESESVCRFMARVLNKWDGVAPTPRFLEFANRQFRTPVNKLLRPGCCSDLCVGPDCVATPCTTPCREVPRCDRCIAGVAAIETYLATNGTAALLGDTMSQACVGRFDSQPETDACIAQITGTLPAVIDSVLANLPPQTTCQVLHRRACAP